MVWEPIPHEHTDRQTVTQTETASIKVNDTALILRILHHKIQSVCVIVCLSACLFVHVE